MQAVTGSVLHLRSSFLADVAFTFSSKVVLMILGLATSIITAKALGPSGRGNLAVALAIGALGMQLGNLGLHSANSYAVAKRRQLAGALAGNSLLVSAVVGGGGAALLGVFFFLRPTAAPVGGWLLTLALAWIPLGLAYLFLQNLLVGLHEIRAFNVIDIINKIVGTALLLLLLLTRSITSETAVVASLAAIMAGVVLVLARLRPYLGRTVPRPSIILLRSGLAYGFRAYLVAAFGFVVLRVDLFMVKHALGPEQAGYYSIASSMADMVYMLPTAVATVLFPRLAAMVDGVTKWRAATKATLLMAVAMLLVAGAAALVARPVIRLFYGKAFSPAVAPFIILAAAMVFYGTNTPLSVYMASVGFPWLAVTSWAAAAALNMGLNVILIPKHGIIGAAIASLLSYGFVFVCHLALAQRMRFGAAGYSGT